MIIYPTSHFRRSFKKLPKPIKEKTRRKDEIFRNNPFASILKTHKLKGKLKNYWAYSVDNNYRILFRFINRDKVIYFDIGTHEVYK
jgi:addiction module RelE/StbE family toxin